MVPGSVFTRHERRGRVQPHHLLDEYPDLVAIAAQLFTHRRVTGELQQ